MAKTSRKKDFRRITFMNLLDRINEKEGGLVGDTALLRRVFYAGWEARNLYKRIKRAKKLVV